MQTFEQYPFLVYGTLRQGMSNHSLLRGRAVLRETVRLPGYRMTITPNGGMYPYIQRRGAESITAEVWDAHVPGEYADLLRSLDSLEGYHPTAPGVNHYDREIVEYVDSHGYMRSGWLYVASPWTLAEIVMDDSVEVESGDWVDVVATRSA